MLRQGILAGISVLLFANGSMAGEKCRGEAYVGSTDPGIAVIYAKPDRASLITQRLNSDDLVAMDRFENGFFHLTGVTDPLTQSYPINYKPVSGWVLAEALAVGVRGGEVYSKPAGGKIIDHTDVDWPTVVVACKGTALQVRYYKTPTGKQRRGWLPSMSQCANPLTTCP